MLSIAHRLASTSTPHVPDSRRVGCLHFRNGTPIAPTVNTPSFGIVGRGRRGVALPARLFGPTLGSRIMLTAELYNDLAALRGFDSNSLLRMYDQVRLTLALERGR